jgi:putative two-component system response regulator
MTSYKVLVVEDDFATGELLKEILEQNDYQVVTRTDGISALKAVEEDTFDLALVDVMLPNLNGFQICERIRDDPRNELMPIIILTVLSESQHRIRALQAGATSFLNKPFDRMELLTQIHSLINLSHKIAKRECFDHIVASFATMLGARNPALLAHGQRVAKLAEQLAYRMGLPLSVTGELKAGALLHDLGKVCLEAPDDEPGGTAGDPSPFVPRHAECGDRMFSHFHRPLARAILRLHHDDGSAGSELGRIGDRQVRLAVQIVAVCNRFDNLVQAGAPGLDGIPAALSRLDAEVRAKGWDREVHAKLTELIRTFGSGLFTVFAPEGGGPQ